MGKFSQWFLNNYSKMF